MLTDKEIDEITNAFYDVLNKYKCSAVDTYAVLGIARHATDLRVEEMAVSQKKQEKVKVE